MSRSQDDRWMRQIGRPVWWEQAFLRPAHTADGRGKFWEGGAPDRGYLYKPAQKIYGLVTSDDREESFDVASAWAQGKCSFTFSAKLNLGPQDRITFLDLPIRTAEEIARGAGASDALTSQLGAVEIIAVVGPDGTIFRAGFDYQPNYNPDKSIASIGWSGGVTPTTGDTYGVHLNVRPRWVVSPDQPKIRSFGAGKRNQLPKRVTLQADDQRVRK